MATLTDELDIPHRPSVPGLRFRHFRGPEDYPGMVAANQAVRDDAGSEEIITVATLTNSYAHLVNSDPADDHLIVERDERVVGYARVEWRDQTDGARTFTTHCLLHPVERRQGIGRAMLAWSEARLAAIAAGLLDREPMPSSMRAYCFAKELGAIALLEQSGWTRSGHWFEMVRPTLDDVPEVALPAGLRLRPIGRDEAPRRRVWDALAEAFRDHRDEPEVTEDDWAEFRDDARQDPSLWLVAFDGDAVAGGVLGLIDPAENAHHGRDRGVLDAVFTRRPWRRRGLARALIARTLVRLRDHGMSSAYLGVDGLNSNQAIDLYRSLGFEVATTGIDWTKPLPGEPRATKP